MDGPTIANIYLLKIKNWNDPAITALNPGVTLPNQPIVVVHRSEGSGTTDNFTHYLAAVSPEWKSGPGTGTAIQWPGGLGAQGNDGVTQIVKQTVGAIGYVEVSYARSNNLNYALVKNQAGNFVDATAANVSAAADSIIQSNGIRPICATTLSTRPVLTPIQSPLHPGAPLREPARCDKR